MSLAGEVFGLSTNRHRPWLHVSAWARIAARRPELASRFVFVTGGALGRAEAEYLKHCDCPTLFKPVELKTLTDLLEGDDPESAPSASVRTLNPPSTSGDRRSSTPAPAAPPSTRR